MDNPLIPLPEFNQPPTADDIYRQLGAIFLLQAYTRGESFNQSFADYYPELLKHFQNGTVFLALSKDRKPQGYVTWQDEEKRRLLTQQVAPFGDHLLLIQQLKQRFADKPLYAFSPNSACKEQRVC